MIQLIEAILQFLIRCYELSFPPTPQYSISHDHIYYDYNLSPQQNERVLPSKVSPIAMNIPAYEAFYLYIQLPISVGTVFPKDAVVHNPQTLLPIIDISTSKPTTSQSRLEKKVKSKKGEKEQIDMTINWGQVLVINDYVSLISRVTGHTLNEEDRLRSLSVHNSLSCFHEDYLNENNESPAQQQPPSDYFTTSFFSFFGYGESKADENKSDTIEYPIKLHNHLPSERIQHYHEHYEQQKLAATSEHSDGVEHENEEADRFAAIREEKKTDLIDDAIFLSKKRSHSISSNASQALSFASTTNTMTSITPSVNNGRVRKSSQSNYSSKINNINDIVFAVEPKTPQTDAKARSRSVDSSSLAESVKSDEGSSAIFSAEARQDEEKKEVAKKSIFSSMFSRSRSSTASNDVRSTSSKSKSNIPPLSIAELAYTPQHRAFYEKLSRISYAKLLKQEFPDAFVVDRKRCLNAGEIGNLKHEAIQDRAKLIGLQVAAHEFLICLRDY